MNILVTGANGFIGRHVVPLLLQSGHVVTIIVRDISKAKQFSWHTQVRIIVADIHIIEQEWLAKIGLQDALIHLAWLDLSNYSLLSHFEETLPANYQFLKTVAQLGIQQILVTGTCFEYGNQSGVLSERLLTRPNNSYALAKDSLRKFLQQLQHDYPFILQWARLFYMYGEGQNPQSLLAQLNSAINEEKPVFNMSGGEQLLDYLAVEKVASYLLSIIERRNFDGVVNVCSGQPISVRQLVEQYLAERKVKMELNLGHYPYMDYEPMAFWGDQQKLQKLLKNNLDEAC